MADGAKKPAQPDFLLVSMADFSLGRGLFIARAASLSGKRVAILTNRPFYMPGARLTREYPDLTFVFIPVPRLPYNNTVGRIVIYLSFAFLSFFRMMQYSRAKVVYVRGMHPFVDYAAIARRRFLRRTRIIADITDLWPDALAYVRLNDGLKRGMIRAGHMINQLALPRVDEVVTHNEVLGKVLERRFSKSPSVIYGVLDLDFFRPIEKEVARARLDQEVRGQLAGNFVVLYAGLLGSFQNPALIVQLAERISGDGLRVVVAGTGPLRADLVKRAKETRLPNITFLPTQPFDSMPNLYGAADVLLMTYADLGFLMIGLPKKFIEYASAGRPIVYVGPPCVAANLIKEWRCGQVFSSDQLDNAARFVESLNSDSALRAELGRNSRRMAESLFSIDGARRVLNPLISA